MDSLTREADANLSRVLKHVEGSAIRSLDVGCGVGLFLGACERDARLESTVGIDSSASVLRYAAEHLNRTVLIRDDFLTFEFVGARFDLVAALAYLHLYPKRMGPQILERIRRLLSDRGVLLASTSIHEIGSEQWEEKSSMKGAWRYRSRYELTEWRELFSGLWEILDEWSQGEIMDPASGKTWHYILAKPRDAEL